MKETRRIRWQDILGRPDWWWGTVTSVTPLQVARGGTGPSVPVTGWLAGVAVGDWVMVQLNGTAPTLIGRQGGPRPLPDPVQFRGPSTSAVSATSWAEVAGTGGIFDAPAGLLVSVTFSGWLATIAGGGRDLRVRCAWTGQAGAGSTGDSHALMSWPGVLYLGPAPSGDKNAYHSASLTFTMPLAAGATRFALQAYTDGTGADNPMLNYSQTRIQPVGWL